MSECFRCGESPTAAAGCESERVLTFADGRSRHPVRFGAERWVSDERACADCNAAVGNYHHPGCSVEACPRCGHHYATCACDTKEKRWLAGNRDIEF